MSEIYKPSLNQKTSLNNTPNVTLLSNHEQTFDTLSDGRQTRVQRLDRIDLGILDDAYQPGANIPQEISFTVGPQRHIMFSSREFPVGFQKIVSAAEQKQIVIGERSSDQSDNEDYPWLHAQFNPAGEIIGVETIAPDVIRAYAFEDGKALATNLPPVQNLQARWYEGADRVNRTRPDRMELPQSTISKEGQVGVAVEGIGSGLSSLAGLFERVEQGKAARAAELGIPIAKLAVEELNAILRSAKIQS